MAGRKVFNEQDARRCLTAVKASRSSLGAWAQEHLQRNNEEMPKFVAHRAREAEMQNANVRKTGCPTVAASESFPLRTGQPPSFDKSLGSAGAFSLWGLGL